MPIAAICSSSLRSPPLRPNKRVKLEEASQNLIEQSPIASFAQSATSLVDGRLFSPVFSTSHLHQQNQSETVISFISVSVFTFAYFFNRIRLFWMRRSLLFIFLISKFYFTEFHVYFIFISVYINSLATCFLHPVVKSPSHFSGPSQVAQPSSSSYTTIASIHGNHFILISSTTYYII